MVNRVYNDLHAIKFTRFDNFMIALSTNIIRLIKNRAYVMAGLIPIFNRSRPKLKNRLKPASGAKSNNTFKIFFTGNIDLVDPFAQNCNPPRTDTSGDLIVPCG